MMPHFPRWLHPALQPASPGLARGTPCSALGFIFAHQRSGEHYRVFEHSLSTGNSFGRVRGIRNPLSLWRSNGTASWAPCQADPYCHEGVLVKNTSSSSRGTSPAEPGTGADGPSAGFVVLRGVVAWGHRSPRALGFRLYRTKGGRNRYVYTKASHKPKYYIASREAP